MKMRIFFVLLVFGMMMFTQSAIAGDQFHDFALGHGVNIGDLKDLNGFDFDDFDFDDDDDDDDDDMDDFEKMFN